MQEIYTAVFVYEKEHSQVEILNLYNTNENLYVVFNQNNFHVCEVYQILYFGK